MKSYILNKETRKIELYFSKEEYNNLNSELKKELKSAYLFSGKAQAWVSRSVNNHYRAIYVAKKLGFEEEEVKGERLSFAEEVERKVEKAEERQNKYENYSDSSAEKAKGLQAEFNSLRGDIAFSTQPIIRGHKGSENFGRRRKRILNRYTKGFDEYRKSQYFSDKAEQMQGVINGDKFKNRVYLNNRIKECNKNIKKYEANIVYNEEINNQDRINYWLEQLEYEIDKLAYMENCLEKIGGIKYNSSNLKVGYEIKIRGHWDKILKLNKVTVESQPIEEHLKMCYGKHDYSEIQEVRIPKDFKEEEIKNPFNIGDIVVANSFAGNRVIMAYKVTKVTAKCANLIEVLIKDNVPTKNIKEGAKETRRQIKKEKMGDRIYLTDDYYRLYKYAM